jgi:hypothetical protein
VAVVGQAAEVVAAADVVADSSLAHYSEYLRPEGLQGLMGCCLIFLRTCERVGKRGDGWTEVRTRVLLEKKCLLWSGFKESHELRCMNYRVRIHFVARKERNAEAAGGTYRAHE